MCSATPRLLALLTLWFAAFASSASAAPFYTGVNLAGAEFGATVLPGTYNTHYTYPTQTEVDYFGSRGWNFFRLCFGWNRWRRPINLNFNATRFNRFLTFVSQQQGKGW